MKIPFVDLKAQYKSIQQEVDSAIEKVINNTSFIGGNEVTRFEKCFAEKNNVSNCVSLANGTDALYVSLKMLGIGEGDEVITTAHSWISTSETISQTGATPVFVDVEPDFYTINPNQIESKITPKTKAIIPVHLYGQMSDMNQILCIAKEYDLFVIEDCAQSHFSEYEGKLAGTMGDVGTFSFYPGKNLGAYGDAGCVITDNDELAQKIRMFSNHGALVKHEHKMEGINSRLDGLQAAVLNVKVNYILDWTEQRIQNAEIYKELLSDIPNIALPKVRRDTKHTFHLFVIKAKKRDDLKHYLEERGISTSIHYPSALPNLPAYNYLNVRSSDFPIATRHEKEILSLPMYPELRREEIDYITDNIKEFYQ